MTITEVKSTENRLERLARRVNRVLSWVFEVRKVGIGLLVLSFVMGFWGYNRVHDGAPFDLTRFLEDYYANVSSELGSVAITVLIIDSLNQRRQRNEDKMRLIRQMGGAEPGLAKLAVRELQALDALKDGSLRGINIERAHLSEVTLGRADLRSAKMDFADLSKGHLFFANLEDADMSGTNFNEAVLTGANLRGVNLVAANLRGALMSEADLTGANLLHAKFNESTQLPDGTSWARGTDMERFTNPDHPKYWRSEMQQSPAYQKPPRGHH